MTKEAYIAITRTVFAIITLVHLLRLFYAWNIQIEGIVIPLWVSMCAVFFAGIISLNGFTLNGK